MAKATRDGHPDRDFSAVMQRGLKAVAVGVTRTHQAAVEPRLPAGMLGGRTGDLQKLGVEVPGVLVIRSSARTARRSLYEAPARGGLVVTAIRTSVLRRGAAGDVRAAYGVRARGRRRERGRGDVGVGSCAARAGYWEYARGRFAGIVESGRSVVTGIMGSGRVGELDRDVGQTSEMRAGRSHADCGRCSAHPTPVRVTVNPDPYRTVAIRPGMSYHPFPMDQCDVLLFVATKTELEELEKSARARGASFDLIPVADEEKHLPRESYWLGMVGDYRIIAVKTRMGAIGDGGSAALGLHYVQRTHATSVICLGMAFGISAKFQSFGDVLVSESVFPYDARAIVPDRDRWRYDYACVIG